MKKLNYFLAATVITATCLTGCRSKSPNSKPKPKEYAQVPLYMAGQQIPGDSQEKYLSNAEVKMYSVGRLVDPGSGTMREAGTVYRIEAAPQWNLIPQYDANPESFARKQLQDQYADSMTGQMNHALTETREVRHSLDVVRQEVANTGRSIEQLSGENAQLKKELQKQNDNITNLLDSMKKMRKYIELLELRISDRNTRNFGGRK